MAAPALASPHFLGPLALESPLAAQLDKLAQGSFVGSRKQCLLVLQVAQQAWSPRFLGKSPLVAVGWKESW